MVALQNLQFDLLWPSDLEAAHAIELAGYPVDEAGSLDAFITRQRDAPDLFLGAFYPTSNDTRELIGFICGTLSPSPTLTHESMSTHVPNSGSVCIHSVCVHPSHRRKGVALALLKEYVSRLEAGSAKLERVLLICHEELRGLYESAGFEFVGESAVVHGSRPWFEMRRVLTPIAPHQPVPQSTPSEPQTIPPGLFEALQRSSTRHRPISRLLPSFTGSVNDLIHHADSEEGFNKFDLSCPRSGCGSTILKAGVGKLVVRESLELEPSDQRPPLLEPLPPPPELTHWWLVTPDPMAFENIGFSKPVQTEALRNKKLLACAECDLGPLGWTTHGGREFWLAASRVGYLVPEA